MIPALGLCAGGEATVSPVLCSGPGADLTALNTSPVSSQITAFSYFPAQDFVDVGGKSLSSPKYIFYLLHTG